MFELFVLPCDFGEMGFVNFELYVGNPSSIVVSIDFSEILVRFQEYGIHKVFQRKETQGFIIKYSVLLLLTLLFIVQMLIELFVFTK